MGDVPVFVALALGLPRTTWREWARVKLLRAQALEGSRVGPTEGSGL